MQKKIALGLLLIVLLPVGLLGWFGVRMVHNEQKIIEHKVQVLLTAQLKSVDEGIQNYFQNEQKSLVESASRLKLDATSLRDFVRTSPHVRQVLVIGADGSRVFPPVDGPLSETEKKFLQRTGGIWDNPAILSHSSGLPFPPQQPIGRVSPSIVTEVEQSSDGWYAWHWDAELHHIFWWRDPARRLIGFELSPVLVMSDIVALLPATGSSEDNLGNAAIRLVNANGQITYQWGRYQPGSSEKRVSMLPLSYPLGSWKLEYFSPVLAVGVATNWFGMLAVLLLLASALGTLAYYLYREQSREMRVAEQRVNFVNQVSHELKTPLTNIRMYAELLENELADDDDKQRKYIGIITAESQRLSRLIANVLSFARVRKEHLMLHKQSGKVDAVIGRCIETFHPAFKARAIQVRFIANAGALVQLDVEVLEQILNNLISNVEKYAASGALMEISSAQHDGRTTITVRDFGPGITKRDQERVFLPFYRVSSRLTDGVTGTGIGLGIARQLARLHGGDLKLIASEQGACFEVSLLTDPVEGTS